MLEEPVRDSLATVFVVGMVFSLLRYNLGKMQKLVKFVKFVNIQQHPGRAGSSPAPY
jgi:hypothetical protein